MKNSHHLILLFSLFFTACYASPTIDEIINTKCSNDLQKKAVMQLAKNYEEIINSDMSNKKIAYELSNKMNYAINCVYERFDSKNGDVEPAEISSLINKAKINTGERWKIYDQYNLQLDGSIFSLPTIDTCE